MSGDLCQPHPTAKQKTSQPLSPQSRIPVSSPSPLRRWGSLRARGEGDNPPFIRPPKISPEANHNGGAFTRGLQRGYSFMERGERRRGTHGVRPFTTAAPRPQTATTEPRSSGALNRAGGGGAPQTPTRNRSLSLSLAHATRNTAKSPLAAVAGVPKTPPSSPDTRHQHYRDWDLDSVASTTSGLSVASCDHASVARNGTTFSGRSKKYVVHCSEHSGATGEDYLTPTQRAHKEVKKLKYLLHQTQKELDLKDTDILRLTKEVVELRLYKAALNSPEDKSNSSSDAITVREVNIGEQDVGDAMVENHLSVEQTSSCADSGHYEDLTNSSVHSKDSVNIGEDISLSPYKAKTPVETADKGITVDLGPRDPHSEHQRLVVEYERRLQDLVRTHEEECHQMKQKHNDKVDELLQRLSEVNTRYWELVPDLESARERIKELEQQLEEACKKLEEQESKQKQTYFEMYNQGREAAKLEHDSQLADVAQENPSRISVPDLLHQLEVTQSELDKVKAMYRQLLEARSKNKIDPEITLQFLKSAIYYFLTDKENNQGHLRAIQSILGFTPSEISNIDKARMT